MRSFHRKINTEFLQHTRIEVITLLSTLHHYLFLLFMESQQYPSLSPFHGLKSLIGITNAEAQRSQEIQNMFASDVVKLRIRHMDVGYLYVLQEAVNWDIDTLGHDTQWPSNAV